MKRLPLLLLLCLLFDSLTFAVPLVPAPNSLTLQGTDFPITAQTRVLYEVRAGQPRALESSLQPLAVVLSEEIELLTGTRPAVAPLQGAGGATDIVLAFKPLVGGFAILEAEEDQSYTMTASGTGGVRIESQYTKGVGYGTATLLQALTETVDGFCVPGLTVSDSPASAYRTIMIDVARQPHSIQVLEGVIEMARLYKFRYVQLHLTDNESFTFPFAPVTDNLTGNNVYPRQELIDLVDYANDRGVTLIPELDLPGHSGRLRASGYLSPSANDRDVADAANAARINDIIDDMLSVFVNTPYFHIGGDESGAGSELVPFLQRVNTHIRRKPQFERPRLLVWEGFHGTPTAELPPTGDDRVVVMSWESSYNTPWNLLNAGYEVINACWKPMYVVGGGGFIHPGSGFRGRFELSEMYRWNKDIFMHFEPGRPVYEDSGPNDPNLDDSEWHAQYIGRQDQVIGGQLLFWEQQEEVVLDELRERAPIAAERMWAPNRGDDLKTFQDRQAVIDDKMMSLVQPVEVLPWRNLHNAEVQNPMDFIYQGYAGNSLEVTMRNRTRVPATIRFTERGFSGSIKGISFPAPTAVAAGSADYTAPVNRSGGFNIRARLFRPDGTPLGSETWVKYHNFPAKLRITEYDINRDTSATVPDLLALPDSAITKRYTMPMVHGRIPNNLVLGQLQESLLTAPGSGAYTFSLKTQSGHASLWIDLNQNGTWEAGEKLISDTPNTEVPQSATANLVQDQVYAIRIDHKAKMPRPVVTLTFEGPNSNGVGNNSASILVPHLTLPPAPVDPSNAAAGQIADWPRDAEVLGLDNFAGGGVV